MINLAGNKDCDNTIKEELYLAGITAVKVEKEDTEVPYGFIGKIGNWTLRRAWYYWIAECDFDEFGLKLDDAVKLHETPHPIIKNKKLGEDIRCGGDCTCPSPLEYGAQPIYNDELDKKLKELGYKEVYFKPLDKHYIDINGGEISKLCNEGKLDVERYVNLYHIDSQVGLNEFAKFIKNLV